MWVIVTKGLYVSRFERDHGIVSKTTIKQHAKKFATREAAKKWMMKYSDCGCALSSLDCSVMKLS